MTKGAWYGKTLKLKYIIRARARGESFQKIADKFECTKAAIRKMYVKHIDENGQMIERGYDTTQREYRLREWQIVMAMYPKCHYCDEEANEAAHIVAHTKANLKQYGYRCVNHHRNMLPTCTKHNPMAMGEARGQVEKDALMESIRNELESVPMYRS